MCKRSKSPAVTLPLHSSG
ncbi:hypothetical protein CP082626L3_0896A, partial [Chlamydia psittaci 08-2626_L3]